MGFNRCKMEDQRRRPGPRRFIHTSHGFAFCEFPRTPQFLLRSWQIPSIATFTVRTPEQKFAFCESTDKAGSRDVPPVMHRPPRVAVTVELRRSRDAAVTSLIPALSCPGGAC
jgi:hypothetical protein